MNENSAIRMVDILALEPAAQNSNLLLMIILPVACLLLLWLGLRYYREPVRQLQRQLQRQQLSPREAAHRIARVALLNTEQHAQLQQMRFSRTSPTPQAMLNFIRELKDR
jgi:hypothetical protein